MGATIEEVPFATEVNGLLAHVVTDEGVVLGPVGPRAVVLESRPDGQIAFRVRFHLAPPPGEHRTLHFDEAIVSVVGRHRAMAVGRTVLGRGDRFDLTYTMIGAWD